MSARCGSLWKPSFRNGGNSGTGNAFEGDVGFDYMGFSFDSLGSKIYDAISSAPLSAAQVATLNAAPSVPQGIGAVAATVSDNTVFQAGCQVHHRAVEAFWWL